MVASKNSVSRSLSTYTAKRNFSKTQEPSGKTQAKDKLGWARKTGHSYLIQKHAARRLHFDFRLEMDGVLKSWAVTRGPSLNPADKRLSVHVEDHPLAYGSFEGTIPQGEYGGGTVMMWDVGTWESVGDEHLGYKKGNLTFELYGKRLKGRWHLVRMQGKTQGKHENWLLIKGKDGYANEDGEKAIEEFQTSAVTNRSMEAIAKTTTKPQATRASPKDTAANSKADSKASPGSSLKSDTAQKTRKLSEASPPPFIPPQLATLVDAPPIGDGWVHEIKFDGYRLEGRLDEGRVRLLTRANNDWTAKFQQIAAELEQLAAINALFDGEIVHSDSSGAMSFHGLQQALKQGGDQNLHYYIFDLLFLDGADLRGLALLERKKKLQELISKSDVGPHLHLSDHFLQPGGYVLKHACQTALEGIVSKRADGVYKSGRDVLWLKSKCSHEQEIVIGGFTLQEKNAKLLGALLMGYYRGKDFLFAGKVGTGFSHDEGKSLLARLRKLETKKSAFLSVPSLSRKGAFWTNPTLVAQIQFMEWTQDGAMRHPSYRGLREDKPAKDVVREKAKPASTLAKIKRGAHARVPAESVQSETETKSLAAKKGVGTRAHAAANLTRSAVVLTHPDKPLYGKGDVTKQDLAAYYEAIAPLMLPQIARRPISLLRCPAGQGKPCFFQRHGSETLSPYVKALHVSTSDKEPYLMIEDLNGLISLVQMGVLEIHVWGSRADKPQQPDRLVLDLDPAPDVPFTEVRRAAKEMRERLKQIKLTSFVKVTGGKGLHVVVPFQRGPTWEQAKKFSRSFSELLVQDTPDAYTVNNRKDVRQGKIFIDYLRNGEGASAVAPYSTRAHEHAPVAAPIEWHALEKIENANPFTVRDVDQLLKRDPWKDLKKIKQKLPFLH